MTPAKSIVESHLLKDYNQPCLTYKQLSLDSIHCTGMSDTPDAVITSAPVAGMVPLVVFQTNNHYQLIDGYKRYNVLRQQQKKSCNCSVVSPTPTPLQAHLLRITLNRHRSFTIGEKLCFLTLFSDHQKAPFFQELRDLVSSDRKEIRLLEALSKCHRSVITTVLNGNLDLSVAPSIQQLNQEDRESMLKLYSLFPFSRQTQKELADWLPELAFRLQSNINTIITSGWFSEIVSHPKLNAPQKIEKLRQQIYAHRFPTISKAKKIWEHQASLLNPDSRSVQFKSAEAFEKNRLEIKITITSAQQAHTIFSSLKDIPIPSWEQLIYPAQLFGEFGNYISQK